MSFSFTPTTGINDITQFPDDDPQIRSHMQGLLDQIKDFINNTAFTCSLGTNGWKKNAITGEIEQWGTFVAPNMIGNGTQQYITIPFPIAFPSAIYNVTFNIGASDTNTNICPIANGAPGLTLTNFNTRIQNNSVNATTNITVFWRAIGK